MQDAQFYRLLEDGRLQCVLCPRYCRLKDGQTGFCHVRKNVAGKLKSLVYGKPYAVNVDPIEKKPLFHFLPGSKILSIGTAGCNMACKYCQNWDLSEAKFQASRAIELPPMRVAQLAAHYNSDSIAYTYNEPTIFAEYAMEIARITEGLKIKNVMVTNGYISLDAIDTVYEHMDAANVDLKAFNSQFYLKQTLSHLQPVLDCLVRLFQLKKWVEITTLIIPGYNDDETEIIRMCEWIIENLSADVPLHLTAFHPAHKFHLTPPTTPSMLIKLRKLASGTGLRYVYLGNIYNGEGSNTYCHHCSALLIKRSGHHSQVVNLDGNRCRNCSAVIPGVFHS